MSARKSVNLIILLVMIFSLFSGEVKSTVSAQPASPVDESIVPHYFGPYPNWALSPLTYPDAIMTINGDGTGATAEAFVGGNGAVTGFNITNPGSGYTMASATISGAGTGATATASVTLSGSVVAINVLTGGADYTLPSVSISGGGASTTATATAYGSVDSLTLDNPGEGYFSPFVDFDSPDDTNGTQAKAHVTFDTNTGIITGIIIDNPGSGYASAPNVVIRDGALLRQSNRRARNIAQAIKVQAINLMQADPISLDQIRDAIQATMNASVTATISITSVNVDTYGAGYTSTPTVIISEVGSGGIGSGATASALTDSGAVTSINLVSGGSGYVTAGGIKKFQDGLPRLCDPSIPGSCVPTNIGQYLPLAVPDTTTFPGTDYYVIGLIQYRERLSSSLPADGTLLREYVQLETADNASWSKSIALQTDLLDGTKVNTLMPNGSQAYGVDYPHYLGPLIQANKDRPVRIVFYNLLPTGSAGDLFIPVDTTFMGSGMGPMEMMDPMDEGTVLDEVRNPMCSEPNKTMMERMMCFVDTRASIHLHGGITPWISDGSPHQWITPADETTSWPEGVAVRQVPDMVGGALPAGVPDCSLGDDGCTTFYYTNQQSARLMFYHDHAWGITRLNVYAGEAAGYIIRDATETALIEAGLLPSGSSEIPLIIQDKTFVPSAAQMAEQDPTWDYTRWGDEGDLWYEHVYMPAENPYDPSGMSAYGRWFYGPWFWPPTTPEHGPIANPYFNMDPATNFTTPLAVACDLNNPDTWQYQTEPFCEPPLIPGTPNNSAGMEQFNDTPLVNGTAYPTVTLDPQSYRLRILNAANDRFWNLQWYVADPRTGTDSEVALNPAELALAQTDPNIFPTPDTNWSPVGPSWIQVGTEGGFLPAPVVIPNQPTTWITDPTRFDVGLVDQHSLLIAPAERADVIVDFSQYAGQTLILYNDAPAAFPARISTYDYYTGQPDLSPNGAPVVIPGYGPNTRTIMQVKIAANPPAPAYNLPALRAAFKHHADGSGVFESGQKPIIVGQAAYNSAYGKNFTTGGWCNSPLGPSPLCDGFARISEQGGDIFKFDTLIGSQIGVKIEPKAIHDEMNSTNFEPFGRMSGNIGVEVVPADPVLQNVVLLPFVNPTTEIFDATNLPTTANMTPISMGSDGTQIWKFTHNGVDTHPLHFHLYDLQLLNRVTWDNIVKPPDANEIGWKDTVRVSPLEDTYFAIRPILPVFPWEIPNSIRPLNPEMPLGDTSMFNPTDVNGDSTAPIVNQLVNFGWEYMFHCHILSHEEMDMMRPFIVAVPPLIPDGLAFSTITGELTWNDNSITETEFVVQKTYNLSTWQDVGSVLSPLDQPNVHESRAYVDAAYQANVVAYRVVARNTVGYGGEYPSLSVESFSAPLLVSMLQYYMPLIVN